MLFEIAPFSLDTLLFKVEQEGNGACHTGSHSCFYRPFGSG